MYFDKVDMIKEGPHHVTSKLNAKASQERWYKHYYMRGID
jgi:hypothetical protein